MSLASAPLASAPLASLPLSGPPPPPPGTTLYTFPAEAIKYRFEEPYTSVASDVKFLGVPRGVYLGFVPTLAAGVLTLGVDATYAVSLLRVTSMTSTTSVDVFTAAAITLDFNGHSTFPVYVIGRVDSKFGGPTSATIMTSITPPATPDAVLICVLTNLTTVLSDAPTNRETPYAYTSAALGYGFMREGAVEQLLAAVAVVAEVQAARVDLSGTTQASLSARLTADGAPAAVADRLVRVNRTIQGESYTLAGAVSSLSIGTSFSALYRTTAPIENVNGFGSETFAGAITDGSLPSMAPAGATSDGERNAVMLADPTTGRRIMSNDAPVYGRLSLSESDLSGTATFTATSTNVAGAGTLFLSQVAVDDLLDDGLGNLYRVAAIVSDISLTLATAALSNTMPTNPVRRRFTVAFVQHDDTGGETSVALSAATAFRLYYTAWRTLEASIYDARDTFYKHGASAPVPVADTTTPGRVLLATAGSLAGAVRTIQSGGTSVGTTGNFHTVNFEGAADAGGGVLDVSQRGPVGLPGLPAGGGPIGPPGGNGPQGVGLSSYQVLFSTTFDHGTMVAGQQYFFDSGTMPFTIRFVTGGLAQWNQNAPATDNNDYFSIINIERLTPFTARLTGQVPLGPFPSGTFQYYMIVAGS